MFVEFRCWSLMCYINMSWFIELMFDLWNRTIQAYQEPEPRYLITRKEDFLRIWYLCAALIEYHLTAAWWLIIVAQQHWRRWGMGMLKLWTPTPLLLEESRTSMVRILPLRTSLSPLGFYLLLGKDLISWGPACMWSHVSYVVYVLM